MKAKIIVLAILCAITPNMKKEVIDTNKPLVVTIEYEIKDYFKEVPLVVKSINPLDENKKLNVKIYQDNKLKYEYLNIYYTNLISMKFQLTPFTAYDQQTKIDFICNYVNGEEENEANYSFVIASPSIDPIRVMANKRYTDESTHYGRYIINKGNIKDNVEHLFHFNVFETKFSQTKIDNTRYYDLSNITFSNAYFDNVETAPMPEISIKLECYLSKDFIYEDGYTIIPLSYTLSDTYSILDKTYKKNSTGTINNDYEFLIDTITGEIRINDDKNTNDEFLGFFFPYTLGTNVKIPFILSVKTNNINNRTYEIYGEFELDGQSKKLMYKYRQMEDLIKGVNYA